MDCAWLVIINDLITQSVVTGYEPEDWSFIPNKVLGFSLATTSRPALTTIQTFIQCILWFFQFSPPANSKVLNMWIFIHSFLPYAFVAWCLYIEEILF
jgi:hypothetical protein